MTSENPAHENHPENHANTATTENSQTAADLTPAARISEPDTPPTPNSYQITRKTEKDWRDKIKFWAELAGLAFLIAYTVFTALMSRANKEAADAARDSVTLAKNNAHLDQRAWVAPFNMEPEQNPAGQTYFKVLYTNTGKTPGLKTTSYIDETGSLDKIPNADPPPKPTDAYGLIAPGEVFNTSTIEHPISPEVIAFIQKGAPLYVFGTIWYSDVFVTQQHWTQFCYRVGTDLKSFGPCPAGKHTQIDEQRQ